MAKSRKPKRAPKPKPFPRPVIAESHALFEESVKLIAKCKFLVQRSEFLYQQGLTYNIRAQELVADCQRSGTDVSDLQARLARLQKKIMRGR